MIQFGIVAQPVFINVATHRSIVLHLLIYRVAAEALVANSRGNPKVNPHPSFQKICMSKEPLIWTRTFVSVVICNFNVGQLLVRLIHFAEKKATQPAVTQF